MVIAELIQDGDKFHFNQDRVSVQQYSSGVKIHVRYDESYDGYIYVWRYSQYIGMTDAHLLEYDSENCIVTLPYAMFKEVTKEAKVFIQGKATKDDHIAQTNTIVLKVVKSLYDTQIVSPDEPSDITLITDIVDQKFKIDIIPQVDEITKDAKQYRDEAKTSADQAEITLNEVTETADREKALIIEIASKETQKACSAIESYKNDKNAELQASVDGWKGEISIQGNEIIQDANVILADVSTISETVSENAETVKTSTQQGETYRDDAGRYASNADLSAQQASASAGSALASKTDAEIAKNNAKVSETIATQKASDASTSENKAKGYWNNAQAEAFNANRSAASALESKNSAQTNADAIRSSTDKIASTEITANKALGDASIAQLTADAGIVGNKKNGELIEMLDSNIDKLKQKNLEHAKVADTDGRVITIADGDGSFLVDYRSFGETEQISNQLLDLGKVTKDMILNGYGIPIKASTYGHNAHVTDFIKLNDTCIVTVNQSNPSNQPFDIAYYDTNKNFMSGKIHGIKEAPQTSRFVQGAHYVRFTTPADGYETCMINYGAIAYPFEQYGFCNPQTPEFPKPLYSKIINEIKVTGANGQEQKVTLSQPITLRGLPVTTGGNVTIDGQQYISDSIEYRGGIYGVAMRIGVVDRNKWMLSNVKSGTLGMRFYYTTENLKQQRYAGVVCTHYRKQDVGSFVVEGDYISTDEAHNYRRINIRALNKQFDTIQNFIDWTKEVNMETCYVFENEIIEPLPLEDQIKIKSLCTFKGSSDITDDANTYKQIRYVVDFDNYAYLKQKSFELALIKQRSGYAVSIDDSTDYYPKSIGMYGETHQTTTTGTNLIDSKKYGDSVNNGVMFTKNSDGSVYALGTATNGNAVYFFGEYINDLEDGVEYKCNNVARIIENGAPKYLSVFIVNKSTMTSIMPYFQITKTESTNKVVYPYLNKDNKTLPWEACTGGVASPSMDYKQEMISNVVREIKVTGANLLDSKYIIVTNNGNYIRSNINHGTEGVISITPLAVYTFSFKTYLTDGHIFIFDDKNTLIERKSISVSNKSITFTTQANAYSMSYYASITTNGTASAEKAKPMLNRGAIALSWEPYKEQKVTLSQPITLRGLPVTSGGNVTIDGQQYVSDSIELVNGEYKHILRVSETSINSGNVTYCRMVDTYRGMDLLTSEIRNSSGIGRYVKGSKCMSDSFRYEAIWQKDIEGCNTIEEAIDFTVLKSRVGITNDMNIADRQNAFYNYVKNNNIEFKFLLILKNEVVTSLPSVDQQAIKELQTYSHNTNITADGVWLSVEYVVDQRINNDRLIKRLEVLEGVVVNNV